MPNSIILSAKDMTQTLFSGMIYCYWDCYNFNNGFEFLHKDGNIYCADGNNKTDYSRLLEVFPVLKKDIDNAYDLGEWDWLFLKDGNGSLILHNVIAENYKEESLERHGEIIADFELAKEIFDDLHLFKKNTIGFMEINGEILHSMNEYEDGWAYLGNNSERYILGQPRQKNLMILGVNPSEAIPLYPDATINHILRIMSTNPAFKDYDGWLIANLSPQRTSDPKNLEESSLRTRNNLKIIRYSVDFFNVNEIWCAWGNVVDTKNFLLDSLKQIYGFLGEHVEWKSYGEPTKKGNPRHPLYMPSNEEFITFSMSDYLQKKLEEATNAVYR